ncbi:MAG: ribosomal protein S18-alanine N-acetyltransferase, partial [Cyanobacteria bacterium P01_F01_bin.4]
EDNRPGTTFALKGYPLSKQPQYTSVQLTTDSLSVQFSLTLTFFACFPLTSALIPAVLALDSRCLGGLWSADSYQREIDSPNSELFVLTQAAEAPTRWPPRLSSLNLIGVGCLWAILEEAHVTTLAIDPDYQHHKLGQRLLIQLLQTACRRQLTHATLEVRVSNQTALNLYQKFDFRVAGRRKKYYSDGEDALILWCSGLQTAEFRGSLQRSQLECENYLQAQGWYWLDSGV